LRSRAAIAQRADISALSDEQGRAADVHRLDVADFRVDVEIVVRRHRDFEMNRELNARGTRLRKRPDDFDAVSEDFAVTE